MPDERVFILGSAAVDEQVSPDGIARVQLGGVVTYGGATFVREGLRATAVCNLEAESRAAIEDALKRLGMDVCAGPSSSPTLFQNRLLADGGRRQQILGIADAVGVELLSAALDGAETPHVHLGPLHGSDIAGDALELIATRADVVTLDVQGFVRRGALGPVREEIAPHLEAALHAADIVKADEAELAVLVDGHGLAPEALLERFDIDEIVVTAGRAGGYVLARGHERGRYRATEAWPPGDATGAGDVFFAAYLVERLHRGGTPERACEHAAVIAAQHVSGALFPAGSLELPAALLRR